MAARRRSIQLNAGRVPAGATVEREVPPRWGNGQTVSLELHDASFTTANRVVQAINSRLAKLGSARWMVG